MPASHFLLSGCRHAQCSTHNKFEGFVRSEVDMIKNNVVLVLGAGASQPYGFQSGLGLKREAQGIVVHNDREFQASFFPGVLDTDEFNEFAGELKRSPIGSIDAFLEARRDFVDIGKHVIAYLMIKRENPNMFVDDKSNDSENWYRYLFNLMTKEGLGGFKDNNLRVVTFNYDRSFEYFFVNGLMSTYGLSFKYAQEQLGHIPIFHVHGQLGKLAEVSQSADSRIYDTLTNPKHVQTAAEGIRIIYELEGEGGDWKGYEQAWGALMQARTIIFLGFGYDSTNISRVLRGDHPNTESGRIFGTTFRFTDSEVRTLIHPEIAKYDLQLVQTAASNKKALDFIRNNLDLFLHDGGGN